MMPASALKRGLRELALVLPANAEEQILAYLELLVKWNRTYNLTAIREPLQMVGLHVLDSLAVLREIPAGSLADVGSGAGLPGIPIAIAEPERPVTVNDANHKKSAFLRQAVIELKLTNTEVHQGRAEHWHPKDRFAVVISRGFADLAEFVSLCRHLARPAGVLAAMKGAYPQEELARLPADSDCGDVRRLRVPLVNGERHLVLCRAGR